MTHYHHLLGYLVGFGLGALGIVLFLNQHIWFSVGMILVAYLILGHTLMNDRCL